jgi:hypothetical protein
MAIDVAHTLHTRRPRHLRTVPVPETQLEFDREYWLAHCEGYRVDGAGGRIGFVEEIRANPADPDLPLLAVRAGRFGRRVLIVPSEAVQFIVPRARRIWLRSPVEIVASEAA